MVSALNRSQEPLFYLLSSYTRAGAGYALVPEAIVGYVQMMREVTVGIGLPTRRFTEEAAPLQGCCNATMRPLRWLAWHARLNLEPRQGHLSTSD